TEAVLLQTHLPPPRIVGAPASGANVCLPGSHRGGAPTTSLPPPRVVGAPASGANVCLPGSHRGGAPTNTPATTPYRRSTRLGCECVPDRFAPGAVLLQPHLPPPRAVGAPAPGANVCLPGSHRGGAPTNTPATTPYRRSTRLGCEYVPAPFAPGAVLLQQPCHHLVS